MEDRRFDDDGSREDRMLASVDISGLRVFVPDELQILGDSKYLADLSRKDIEKKINDLNRLGKDKSRFTPMAFARIDQIRRMLEGALK